MTFQNLRRNALLVISLLAIATNAKALPLEISFGQAGPSSGFLSQIAPAAIDYVNDVDFDLFHSDGVIGSVSGFVDSVAGTATGGCSASDYAGFTSGSIALVADTICLYSSSINLATAAGATGVLVIPMIDIPFAYGLVDPISVPALLLSHSLGAEFEAILARSPVPVSGSLWLLCLGLGAARLTRTLKRRHVTG